MPRRKLTEEEKKARKTKKKAKEELERMTTVLRSDYERHLDHCERGNIPDNNVPSRRFEIGTRVECGRHDWVVIYQIFEDYKFYKLIIVHEGQAYGKSTGHSFKITYQRWTEILPYRTKEQGNHESPTGPERLEEDRDIRFSYSQRNLQGMLWTMYSTGMDLDTDYQRGNEWTETQKVQLIDSIFKNIDIGKFTIIRRPLSTELDQYYECLDGKQRLTALREFYEDRFRYKGKLFSELCWRDQGHFESYSINYAETEPLTKEQKYRYFLKLNTSGVPIQQAHFEKVKKLWIKEKKRNLKS